MNGRYLERNGVPTPVDDLLEWAREFETADRVVSLTSLADTKVSTVFLGLDHSFGGDVPLLYETMVFGGEHDGWQDRYPTRQLAIAGHERVVEALRSGKRPAVSE